MAKPLVQVFQKQSLATPEGLPLNTFGDQAVGNPGACALRRSGRDLGKVQDWTFSNVQPGGLASAIQSQEGEGWQLMSCRINGRVQRIFWNE